MKYLFTILCCFSFSCAFAETIRHVEYQLPKAAADWVASKKIESKNGTTIIYTPSGVERKDAEEFFGVNANKHFSNIKDTSSIKSGIAKIFPKLNIDLTVLEQDEDSVTYEWSGEEDGIEKVHGWGRVFSSKTGTVVLAYHTENRAQVAQSRLIWLPALKEAKR